MNEKMYLQRRTEYFLQKAIDEEIERINELKENGLLTIDVSNCCTEIGVLVALKRQAKELIDSL
ncbi:MAG: hypothetical protein DBY43_06370 [Clostridiaceae bacterium]|nr:MAG: hypothetical protein DBY43_06370 [Clostridiaceae bacterium]